MDQLGTPADEGPGPTGPPAHRVETAPTLASARPFQLHDRVHRLNGISDTASWGTIIGRSDGGEWLVFDNIGVTHCDRPEDLTAAVRGSQRTRRVPIQNDGQT